MIKVRLHGTPEEINLFANFLKGLADVRVLSRSEPSPDRGKSVYERIYMDVEFSTPTIEITVEDNGECPYKGTAKGKDICILSLEPTNDAVQCAFEYENCYLYQHCEHYKKKNAEGNV